jgi:thioredoxin reductase (NADPH)
MDLGTFMHTQAEKAGAETTMAEVTGLKVAPGNGYSRHVVVTSEEEVSGLAVVIATGAQYRALGVPGEAELTGRGVSYCATCDGPFYRGKKVVVVGGGDTAVTDALELTHYAEEVTLIHRRNELRASKALQDKAFNDPKIRFLWSSVLDGIEGDPVVNTLRVRNLTDDIITQLRVDGVFVAVGSVPSTDFVAGVLPLDESGCIVTNELMETTIAGVLAAGDVRHNSARQVVTAAGDGATAALSARRYISSL